MLRKVAVVIGVVYLMVGLLGFIPGLSNRMPDMPPMMVEMSYGKLLDFFPVNILHNLVHIGIGIWGILAYRKSAGAARFFLRTLAVIYALLAILGLIPATNTMFGLVPIYGHDVWLHALTAAIAGFFGFLVKQDSDKQTV
jgi:hypothetical protein